MIKKNQMLTSSTIKHSFLQSWRLFRLLKISFQVKTYQTNSLTETLNKGKEVTAGPFILLFLTVKVVVLSKLDMWQLDDLK